MPEPTTGTFADPAVRRFLQAPERFATIATVGADGTPHQAVVWFLVREDAIVVNSKIGRRWPTDLLRDPRVSLTVESAYDYVILSGQVEPLEDQARAQADIAEMARRYNSPEAAERQVRTFSSQQRISFRIRPTHVAVHGELEP